MLWPREGIGDGACCGQGKALVMAHVVTKGRHW